MQWLLYLLLFGIGSDGVYWRVDVMYRSVEETKQLLIKLGFKWIEEFVYKNTIDGGSVRVGTDIRIEYKGKNIDMCGMLGFIEPEGLTQVESILYRALLVMGEDL